MKYKINGQKIKHICIRKLSIIDCITLKLTRQRVIKALLTRRLATEQEQKRS